MEKIGNSSIRIAAVLFTAFLALCTTSFASVQLSGNWEYRIYKNVQDAGSWSPIPAGGLRIPREYQGYIEYRTNFNIGPVDPRSDLGVYLGRIGDVDETFVNEYSIGSTGAFPPHYQNNMDVVREYKMPPNVLSSSSSQSLRVLTYVEYVSSKGINIEDVVVGSHRELQHKQYVADLWWFASRMFIPILCLVLAAFSVPWLAPSGFKLQQTIILLFGFMCFIFGVCRSRVVFHFVDIVLAYKFTGGSSVWAVTLISWLALTQSAIARRNLFWLAMAACLVPATYFSVRFSLDKTVLDVAVTMKQWFAAEAVMIWSAAILVGVRASRSRRWLKLGFVFLALIITNDILRDLRVFKLPILMDLGFGIFLFALIVSQIINLRLSWVNLARREVQHEQDIHLGRISALLTHDLRSKIATVSTLVDTTSLPAEIKDKIASLLGRIKESVDLHLKQASRLEKVTKPLTRATAEIAKIESDADRPACSIGGTVQTCVDDAKRIYSFEAVIDIPKKAFSTFVPLEFCELSRAISNLLNNAIDATAPIHSGPKIYVSVQLNGEWCEVLIKDFGAGFEPQVLNAVLGGQQATTKEAGNGFGIISAQTILKRVGGDLKINSGSMGSVVRMILPRVDVPSWFFDIANSTANEIIVLDDDTSIHVRIKGMFADRFLYTTSSETEFLAWAKVMPNALLLVDHDFGGNRTGVDLINQESLTKNAVLISGMLSVSKEIRAIGLAAGVKMVPKECFEKL